jgi:hypothetical protein
MAATADLCDGTCIWVYDSGSWTVKSSDCTAGCGCIDSGSRAKYFDASKKQLVVPHADFLDRVRTMLKDPRVIGLKQGPRLLKQVEPTSPTNGDEFETACLK